MSATLKDRESFVFSDSLSELPFEPRSEEQIRKQLFHGSDPEKLVDAYEEQLGIRAPETPMPKMKVSNIMLSPGTDDDDSTLLNQLYNDTELYQVIEKSAYWTPRGEYKIFVIYSENLDVKEARLKKQEKVNTDE